MNSSLKTPAIFCFCVVTLLAAGCDKKAADAGASDLDKAKATWPDFVAKYVAKIPSALASADQWNVTESNRITHQTADQYSVKTTLLSSQNDIRKSDSLLSPVEGVMTLEQSREVMVEGKYSHQQYTDVVIWSYEGGVWKVNNANSHCDSDDADTTMAGMGVQSTQGRTTDVTSFYSKLAQ